MMDDAALDQLVAGGDEAAAQIASEPFVDGENQPASATDIDGDGNGEAAPDADNDNGASEAAPPNSDSSSGGGSVDIGLPAAAIARILKAKLPPSTMVSKEAKTSAAKAASIFILYLSSRRVGSGA